MTICRRVFALLIALLSWVSSFLRAAFVGPGPPFRALARTLNYVTQEKTTTGADGQPRAGLTSGEFLAVETLVKSWQDPTLIYAYPLAAGGVAG